LGLPTIGCLLGHAQAATTGGRIVAALDGSPTAEIVPLRRA